MHTGQHYDAEMSDQFFKELGIPEPTLNLGIGSARHGDQTGRMLTALEVSMMSEKPDWVLVYGDTNSTLAGALAAAKLHIPVAHIEAGLRSFNRRMPEEINRIVTDHLSTLLFAPTEEAVCNLANEGIKGSQVVNVGDVMYDLALHMAGRAKAHSRIHERLGLERGAYVVATIHRAENTDDPTRLTAILGGFGDIARDLPVVLPLHPRTRKRLADLGITPQAGVITLEPLSYLDITSLVIGARLVATDSGGLQKEAFFHGTPCVTLRHETEWVELVALGWNRIVPPISAEQVTEGIRAALGAPIPPRPAVSPYGDGASAKRIVECLCTRLGK